MNTSANLVTTVQSMYAAFSRGDIPAILGRLGPDIDWHINADPRAPGVASIPILRPFRGPKDVGEFFAGLGRDLEFHSFQPVAFLSNENQVAARVHVEITVRKTQRRLRLQSVHLFAFDAAGRVTHFHEFSDTLAVAGAWGAVAATG